MRKELFDRESELVSLRREVRSTKLTELDIECKTYVG